MRTFKLVKSELVKILSNECSLFKCNIEINGIELEGLYISSKTIKTARVVSIAYSDVKAYLVFCGEGCLFDKSILLNLGYKVYMKINWDHLLCRPHTFLKRNMFVHYSANILESILPVSLNVGNKYSGIKSSSFWIIPGNHYSTSVYGDKTDESNIVYNFYRRFTKEVFVNSEAFLIWPYKDIKIYVLDDFYYGNKKRIDNMVLYAYTFFEYGFFASIGCEYSMMEYTFDEAINNISHSEIKLSDFKHYIEIISREQFLDIKDKVINAFKEKHFCDIINSIKPEVYYDYEELVERRKEVKNTKLLKGRYYNKRIDYDFDGIDVYKKLYVTGDLHIGKKENSYKDVVKAIDDFWEFNRDVVEYLLLLGDVIDADYLSKEEMLLAHKYFVKAAKCNVFLVLGNNDLLAKEDYLACGYKKVWNYIIYGNIIFSHMPVSCDSTFINIHAHLHGRRNYINIVPFNHIDVGYKACNNKMILLQEYVALTKEQAKKTYQFLDIYQLFDKNTVSLYEKYNRHYYVSDCIIESL